MRIQQLLGTFVLSVVLTGCVFAPQLQEEENNDAIDNINKNRQARIEDRRAYLEKQQAKQEANKLEQRQAVKVKAEEIKAEREAQEKKAAAKAKAEEIQNKADNLMRTQEVVE